MPVDTSASTSTAKAPAPGQNVSKRILLGSPSQFPQATSASSTMLCCVAHSDKFPADTSFTFGYLNKGAANAVFTIHPSYIVTTGAFKSTFQLVVDVDDTTLWLTARPVSREKTTGKVLRVPRGKAKTLSGEEIVSSFHKLIKPLFLPAQSGQTADGMTGFFLDSNKKVVQVKLGSLHGDLSPFLMHHEGVLLFHDAMSHLRSLVGEDVFTAPKAKGPPGTCWGVLLEDMSPVPNKSITLEIKPKWLLQSPDAPLGAIRCRTCAMQILSPKERTSYICPLRLLRGKSNDIRPWLHSRVDKLFNNTSQTLDIVDRITEHLLSYLTFGIGGHLLQHLEFLQSKLDPCGVLSQDAMATQNSMNFNLRAAMTLRDCSLFIKVEYDSASGVPSKTTSKLGDLDFKAAEKTADWAEKEKRLKEGDAYTKVLSDDFGCWLPQMARNI